MSEVVKVKDLPYKRYTIEEGEELFKKFEEAYLKAENADDVLKARENYIKPLVIKCQSASSLSYCRYTLNTADEFYNGEREYYDEKSPLFSSLFNKYSSMMLSSPYRKELEEKLNPGIFKNYEVALKCSQRRDNPRRTGRKFDSYGIFQAYGFFDVRLRRAEAPFIRRERLSRRQGQGNEKTRRGEHRKRT